VVFFSDAVFAIAMTLLALSLRLPATTTDHGVARALGDALPSIYSYALSFTIIALYWLAHHRMFRYICRLNVVLLGINLATLGVVAFVPFPTSVLGDHGASTAAVVFYAATMAVLGALVTALWGYASHGASLDPGRDTDRVRQALVLARPRGARSVRGFDTHRIREPECRGVVLVHHRLGTAPPQTAIWQHLQAGRVT
jgi:uncharacterized membrane protein